MAKFQQLLLEDGNKVSYKENDCLLEVDVHSNGETYFRIINLTNGRMNVVKLTNKAAHEIRDFLNQRFPNATAVQ